jgi:hypothetical protein
MNPISIKSTQFFHHFIVNGSAKQHGAQVDEKQNIYMFGHVLAAHSPLVPIINKCEHNGHWIIHKK